ncbi:unnamed protein product [Gongylonema pulchrum]|uniref:CHDNT domain-containing protein n=1 Tax=Gongylonema pulchrum TaxID=637853 RepID=A0A183CXY7_9BILA|nr:unnamed protein product [Gongylonema pulchrum]
MTPTATMKKTKTVARKRTLISEDETESEESDEDEESESSNSEDDAKQAKGRRTRKSTRKSSKKEVFVEFPVFLEQISLVT